MARWRPVLLLVLLGSSGVSAKVQLMGEEALLRALEHQPPCCVIDARPAKHRTSLPLPD